MATWDAFPEVEEDTKASSWDAFPVVDDDTSQSTDMSTDDSFTPEVPSYNPKRILPDGIREFAKQNGSGALVPGEQKYIEDFEVGDGVTQEMIDQYAKDDPSMTRAFELSKPEAKFKTQDELVAAFNAQDTGQGRVSSDIASGARGAGSIASGIVGGAGSLMQINPVTQMAQSAKGLGITGAETVENLARAPGEFLEKTVAPWIQSGIESVTPVNPIYQNTVDAKISGALGQAAGQLGLVLGTGGAGLAPEAATLISLGTAGLQGAYGGSRQAEEMGITGPKKDAMSLLAGALAIGTERMTGVGNKGFTKQLLDKGATALAGGALKKEVAKTILGEGLEEGVEGIGNDIVARVLSEEDPENKGFTKTGIKIPSSEIDPTSIDFWAKRGEEAALGMVGGGLFGGYQAMTHNNRAKLLDFRAGTQKHLGDLTSQESLTPEQKKDVANLIALDAAAGTQLELDGLVGAREIGKSILDNDEKIANSVQALVDAEPTPEGKQRIIDQHVNDIANVEKLMADFEAFDQATKDGNTKSASEIMDSIRINPAHDALNAYSKANQEKALNITLEEVSKTPEQVKNEESIAQEESKKAEVAHIQLQTSQAASESDSPMTAAILEQKAVETLKSPNEEAVRIEEETQKALEKQQEENQNETVAGIEETTDNKVVETEASAQAEGNKTNISQQLAGRETVVPSNAASMPLMVTRDMEQQLSDLGYSKKERNSMSPQVATDIISSGARKEKITQATQTNENKTSTETAQAINPQREGLEREAVLEDQNLQEPAGLPADAGIEIGMETPSAPASPSIDEKRTKQRGERVRKKNAPQESSEVSPELGVEQVGSEQAFTGDQEVTDFNKSVRDYVQTLPPKAQERWTPEVLSQIEEYHRTGNKSHLDTLTAPQRGAAMRLSEDFNPEFLKASREAERFARLQAIEDEKFNKETTEPSKLAEDKIQFSKVDELESEKKVKSMGVPAVTANRAVTALQKTIGFKPGDVVVLSKEDVKNNVVGLSDADAIYVIFGKVQAFYFRGKSYILPEYIEVEEGYTPYEAVASKILHEHVIHQGIDFVKKSHPDLYRKWLNLSKQIPASELEKLISRAHGAYSEYSDYETNSDSYDSLAQEWLAEKFEKIGIKQLNIDDGTLTGKFMGWLKDLFQRVTGIRDSSISKTQMDRAIQELASSFIAKIKSESRQSTDRVRFSKTTYDPKIASAVATAQRIVEKAPVEKLRKVGSAWRGIGNNPKAHRLSKELSSKDMSELFKQLKTSKDVKITEESDPSRPEIAWKVESPRGRSFIYKKGDKINVDTSEANGKGSYENPENRGKAGESTLVYQASQAYAHNNGLKFTPDYSGVSPIAQFRRWSQMLSAAVRFNDTTFLDPRNQYGVEEVKQWTDGKDVESDLGALALSEMEYVKKVIPEFSMLTINVENGNIIDNEGDTIGNITSGTLEDIIRGGDYAENFGIGPTTLRRALITKSATTGNPSKQLGFDEDLLYDDVSALPEGNTVRTGSDSDVSAGREALGQVGVLYSKTQAKEESKSILKRNKEKKKENREDFKLLTDYVLNDLSIKTGLNNKGNIPLTKENTERITDLANRLESDESFTDSYMSEFKKVNPGIKHTSLVGSLKEQIGNYGIKLVSSVRKTVPGSTAHKSEMAKLNNGIRLMNVGSDNYIDLGGDLTASTAGRALAMIAHSGRMGAMLRMLGINQASMQEQLSKGKLGKDYDKLEEAKDKAVEDSGDRLVDEFLGVDSGKRIDVDLKDADTPSGQAQAQENTEKAWDESILDILSGKERERMSDVIDDAKDLVDIERRIAELEARQSGAQFSAASRAETASSIASMSLAELRLLRDVKKESLMKNIKKLNKESKVRGEKVPTNQKEAQDLLKRLEAVKAEKPETPKPVRDAFREQVKSGGSFDDFSKKMSDLGINTETTKSLYDKAKSIKDKKDSEKIAKLDSKAFESSKFLKSIFNQWQEATLQQRSNPEFRRQIAVDAFMAVGFTEEKATQAATAFESYMDKKLTEVQNKALVEAGRVLKLDHPSLEKLAKAYRAGVFDSTDPVAKIMLESSGMSPLSNEDIQKLAVIDEQLQNTSNQTLIAKYQEQMREIFMRTKPPASVGKILTQAWVSSVLSGARTMALNYINPVNNIVRNMGRDMVGVMTDSVTGKMPKGQALAMIANIFEVNIDSLTKSLAALKNALKTDTAIHVDIAILLKEGTSLKRDNQDSVKKFKSAIDAGNYAVASKELAKVVWTSTDYVRRLLSSADEMYASVNFNNSLYIQGARALSTIAKYDKSEIDKVMDIARRDGEERAKTIIEENNVTDSDQQKLILQDESQSAFLEHVKAAVENETGESSDIDKEILETADLETSVDSGNRGMEEAPAWDVVNNVLNIAIKMSQSARSNGHEFLGRILTGFVTVPANIFNRSAYYTPYGLLRTYAQERSRSKDNGEKFYQETMKADQQIRLRKLEGYIGTIGAALIAALMSSWKDEEGNPIVSITGQGSTDKAAAEAEKKGGFQPNSLMIRVGDRVVAVRVSEGLNIPVSILAAIDDMRRNGKTKDKMTAEWAGEFLFTAIRNLGRQASFMSPKSIVSQTIAQGASGRSIGSSAAGIITNFIPFSGLIRSMDKIINGPKDQSSMKAALIANTPIAGTLAGNEALNFLGDNVNLTPDNLVQMMSDRFYQSGIPVFLGSTKSKKHDDIYAFIRDTGITPTIPNRGAIEKQYGYFTEDGWKTYIQTRGAILADQLTDNIDAMREMDEAKAESKMRSIDSKATEQAKAELGMEKLPVK